VNAQAALARGITAQRQGTEVAALSYYFQAAAIDPSLLEAANRSSVMSTNISSGNIGQDVRNDIAWRTNWVQRLTEAEQSFAEFNRTQSMPYTLFYSDGIAQGTVNYQNETVTLSIETNLHPSHTWRNTVGVSMQRTLRAVYDGLQATKRTGDWGLNSWPNQGVTNLDSFAGRSSGFDIDVELLDERNRVIGRQSFRVDGSWGYTYEGNAPTGVRISDDVSRTVSFTVKADDISDRLTIRIARVNGVDAETAARNGVLQVRAISKGEFDRNNTNNSSRFNFVLGEIRGSGSRFFFDRDLSLPSIPQSLLSIPPSIWGDPVVSIGEKAFYSKASYDSTRGITIVYLPDSVISGIDTAWLSIYLPDSVTSVGERALYVYSLPSNVTDPKAVPSVWSIIGKISIGANVTLISERNGESVGNGFEAFYNNNGRKAGTYTNNVSRWGKDRWSYSDSR
jgi:hypothetical protein